MPQSAPSILPIDTATLGDRSYLVHDGRVGFVVDPQRDIDRVLDPRSTGNPYGRDRVPYRRPRAVLRSGELGVNDHAGLAGHRFLAGSGRRTLDAKESTADR